MKRIEIDSRQFIIQEYKYFIAKSILNAFFATIIVIHTFEYQNEVIMDFWIVVYDCRLPAVNWVKNEPFSELVLQPDRSFIIQFGSKNICFVLENRIISSLPKLPQLYDLQCTRQKTATGPQQVFHTHKLKPLHWSKCAWVFGRFLLQPKRQSNQP